MRLSKILFLPLLVMLLLSVSNNLMAQVVNVGAGSYSTTLPLGQVGPLTFSGQPAIPKVSAEFDQLINTNDYWTNLIYPFLEGDHITPIHAHPLTFQASENGFHLGHTGTHSIDLDGSLYFFDVENQLTVGIAGATSNQTTTHNYGDWTFTAKMEYNDASLIATTGHGLPYTFFDVNGGEVQVTSDSTFSIWHDGDEVVGIHVDGRNYGVFAPNGSVWAGTDTLTSSLNGKGFLSIAILPDSTAETLEFFRQHAYAQVTNSLVSWNYDEFSADLATTFTYETILRDSTAGNSDETLTALFRHQWLNTSAVLTDYSYNSPRGEMKVYDGNSFSTTSRFSGILPALPDLGEYNRIQLLEHVQQVADEVLIVDDTYDGGKALGRFAELVHIADQLGAVAERDHFLSEMKLRLEDWFTAGGAQEYSYNATWNLLTGYPANHASDSQINDHHFHSSYAIKAAATIAMYDSVWASQENWGGMVNLLIRDANNWNRDDELLPFLRNFDAYAGHGWASGHGDFSFLSDIFGEVTPGNNQESSSESMNFSTAAILWGEVTGQEEIRDLGIFLYTNENEAIDQYWFDVDDEVFPNDFLNSAVGIVWGDGGYHGTWFGDDPEFIHGINLLPINAGSFYLAKNPEYIISNYNDVVTQLGSQPTIWKDVFWQYLAMSDPDLTLTYYNDDLDYTPFDGESRAHTMHWLYNMKELGQYNTEVTADISTYSVFVDQNDDTTYIAYNSSGMEQLVTYSDGFAFTVPARSMSSYHTAETENALPASPEPTNDPETVISIFSDSYPSAVEVNFNIDEGQASITSLVSLEGNNVLKFDGLDFQTLALDVPINVTSRDSFRVDFWTENASALSVYLVSADEAEQKYDFSISTGSWQSVNIDLSTFTGVNLGQVSEVRFEGDGTVYVDNLLFSGDGAVTASPGIPAPAPMPDEVDVISIFSDNYTNVEGTDLNPNWGQATVVSIEELSGNSMLKYENLNYQGTQFGDTLDVSEMGWFHLDYWTADATELEVSLISPGPLETPYEITVRTNEWQSIDIPLEEFAEVVNLTEVFQLKIEGNGTIFFDNFYFGKTPALTAAPTPTHNPNGVVSLFSDAYENISVDTWSAVWDQANLEDIVVDGDNIKLYSNLNFAGIEFIANQVDANSMPLTNFRFDLFTFQPTVSPAQFSVKLVDFGANGVWSGGDDVEDELFFNEESMPALATGEWISFDLPLDDFENMTTRSNLSQLLFIGAGGLNEVYIDNIYFYNNGTINSIESNESDIPERVVLEQNYPNPFNPSTNIEFGIPEASNVSLVIYNSIGQRVATVVDRRLSAGMHNFNWEASNLTSGLYFYRLESGSSVITKKMLLIK